MQNINNVLPRRRCLKALLTLGIVLGVGPLTQALDGPFTSGTTWDGFRTSAQGAGANPAQLVITGNSGNPIAGVLNLTGTPVPVQVGIAADGSVSIAGQGPYAGLSVKGTVAMQIGGSYLVTGTYQCSGVPGMHDDRGRLSLLRLQPKGPVTGDPDNANVPADAYFPPDFLGQFFSQSGVIGQVVLHRDAAIGGADWSAFPGMLRFNEFGYRFVVTFAPRANTDGSYNFDLIGDDGQATSLVPLIRLSGKFSPAVQRVSPASLRGTYTLIGARGSVWDRGSVALQETQGR